MADRIDQNNSESITNGTGKLQDFILTEYERQKEQGEMTASAEIDEDRMKNFFNKALSASQKMNSEIAKSQMKMDKLHQEMSREMFDAWRNEHATEVLLPHQVEAVQLASKTDHTME